MLTESTMRLRGGGTMRVRIQPRLQKETWSLYWKESMHTDTECLDAFELDVDPTVTVYELQARPSMIAKFNIGPCRHLQELVVEKMKWTALESLLRLDGFEECWQRCLHKGRELAEDMSLDQCDIGPESTLTIVRKELIAEG